MTDLREAFLKASKETPGNFLSSTILQSASRVAREQAEYRRFGALARKYNKLGNAVYQINMKHLSYKGEDRPEVLKRQWKDLQDDYNAVSPERRQELLLAFATGLRLTGEKLDFRYEDTFQMMKMFGRVDVPARAKDTGFEIRARIFLDAIHMYEASTFSRMVQAEKSILNGSKDPLGLQETIRRVSYLHLS